MEKLHIVYIHGIGGSQEGRINFHKETHETIKNYVTSAGLNNYELNDIDILWQPDAFNTIISSYQSTYANEKQRELTVDLFERFKKSILVNLGYLTFFILSFIFAFQLRSENLSSQFFIILWILINFLMILLIFRSTFHNIMDEGPKRVKNLYFISGQGDELVLQLMWYSHHEDERLMISTLISNKLRANGVSEGSNVIFIGHSLGSVIAVNYLSENGYINLIDDYNSSNDIPFNLVALITLASPLRFYTNSLKKWNKAAEIKSKPGGEDIKLRKYCNWYNILDEHDLIARSLNHEFTLMQRSHRIKDLYIKILNKGKLGKFYPRVNSHTGYWLKKRVNDFDNITKIGAVASFLSNKDTNGINEYYLGHHPPVIIVSEIILIYLNQMQSKS